MNQKAGNEPTVAMTDVRFNLVFRLGLKPHTILSLTRFTWNHLIPQLGDYYELGWIYTQVDESTEFKPVPRLLPVDGVIKRERFIEVFSCVDMYGIDHLAENRDLLVNAGFDRLAFKQADPQLQNFLLDISKP